MWLYSSVSFVKICFVNNLSFLQLVFEYPLPLCSGLEPLPYSKKGKTGPLSPPTPPSSACVVNIYSVR